jgi:hypothetical protein
MAERRYAEEARERELRVVAVMGSSLADKRKS